MTIETDRPDPERATSASRRRVGLFGGTFDPPHLGHASVAAQAADALRLDRVLWIPASVAPHKIDRVAAPPPARRRMVAAATRADPRFRLCDLELRRGGVSYTVDTLRAIRRRRPEWSLWLLVGTDLAETFREWREAEAVARMASLAAIPRPREATGGVEPFRTVQVAPVDLSSSRVRDRLARGLPVQAMVAPAVMTIIEDEGLYRRSAPPARADEPEGNGQGD